MKWLKLDCDFRNDPKIRALSRQWGGQEAAGFWTLLLGFVGAHGGPECRVQIREGSPIDERYLAEWFAAAPRSLRVRLALAAQLGLIEERAWNEDSAIFIPNMLKRVDDYTRKILKSPDTVRTKSEVSPKKPALEEEVDREREIEERKKRKPAAAEDPRRGPLKDFLFSEFKQRRGVDLITDPSCWKAFENLLRATRNAPAMTVDEIRRRWILFLSSDRPFHREQGQPLRWFCQNINAFAGVSNGTRQGSGKLAAVANAPSYKPKQ